MMVAHNSSDDYSGQNPERVFDETTRDAWTIEPMPEGLIDSPLDFIFAEHHRQRQAALVLNLVADGEVDDRGLAELIDFLEGDFAMHISDEELDFFPTLKQCCKLDDKIDPLIARLVEEHKDDQFVGDDVICRLKKIADGAAVTGDDSGRLRAFAEHIRQHLALENAVLLPIARVRMGQRALRTLSDCLKARRRNRTQ